jgi:hypothetical protein
MAAHGPIARGWSRWHGATWLRAEMARWTAPVAGARVRLRADRAAGLAMGFIPTQF